MGEHDHEPLPDWVREMAACVDLPELGERVVVRDITVAFPRLAGDTDFAEHLRSSVRENLHALQQVLCGRLALAQVRLEQPLEFARVQARLRIPQTALQRFPSRFDSSDSVLVSTTTSPGRPRPCRPPSPSSTSTRAVALGNEVTTTSALRAPSAALSHTVPPRASCSARRPGSMSKPSTGKPAASR
jgi:hypothetical protein